MTDKMKTSDWFKCYGQAWGDLCVPAAVAHPAKFSRKLIFRIFEHAIEEGWVKSGETCLDPFGGVALGALPAQLNGLHWVGIELEARFCALAQDNIDLWNKRYAEQMPDWGSAVIVQGDSRRLGEVLARARLCLGSPPYAGNPGAKDKLDNKHLTTRTNPRRAGEKLYFTDYATPADPMNLGNLPDTGFEAALAVSSPVYSKALSGDTNQTERDREHREAIGRNPDSPGSGYPRHYGDSSGQLAQMPEGALALAISSPPFLAQSGGTNVTAKSGPLASASLLKRHSAGNQAAAAYGNAAGQLAALPEGDHAEACERPVCCISSPPWESSIGNAANTPETKMVRPKLPNANEVAAYLKQKRIEKGLSLRKVDDYLGTVTLYSWYEGRPAGTQIPTPENWRKLKALLGLDDRFDSGILTVEKMRATSLDTVNKTGHFQMTDYGKSKGQLAQMPPGDHAAALEADAETGRAQACISSPPFGGSLNDGLRESDREKYAEFARAGRGVGTNYGSTAGQLGQQQGATFWAASRQILEEVYKVLAPGAHAIFVCKRFVRSKKIVEFPLQWARLCESVGFRWIHHHKAWLVEHRGAQHTLEGGLDVRQVKRMSFFRRLHATKYPHLEILWEDVLCFVKEA